MHLRRDYLRTQIIILQRSRFREKSTHYRKKRVRKFMGDCIPTIDGSCVHYCLHKTIPSFDTFIILRFLLTAIRLAPHDTFQMRMHIR